MMQRSSVRKREWSGALKEFSNRNAGRRTSLEVDDPRYGAQVQQHGYQLLGVSYDPKDERVQVMLGTFEGIGPRLTHTIGQVVGLDLMTDDRGRDVVLRIAQSEAQTLLRLEQFDGPIDDQEWGRR